MVSHRHQLTRLSVFGMTTKGHRLPTNVRVFFVVFFKFFYDHFLHLLFIHSYNKTELWRPRKLAFSLSEQLLRMEKLNKETTL